ncbi:MAG: hypothetical protein AUF79_05395 [Crenarchaeota archaeon 13_1_20CM_2_51_8]|nr:MAG: hypothetical protein AUF79_05395 [Crenarchaeota archaeon 13_1_20CM_2_51_8]
MASSTLLGVALAGLASAVVMTLFEFPFWRRWGMNGVAEWQSNWIIISKLTRGNSSKIREPRISWTVSLHLWHGVATGIVFGLLLPYLTLLPAGNLSVLLDAVVYSVALWILFMLAPRRAFESGGGTRISDLSLSIALASHLVYGIFLGLLVPFA